jgi:hypothetical protein
MTKTLKLIGAALLALAILPAAVLLFSIPIHALFIVGLGVAGTVTVTYQNAEVNSAGAPAPGGGYTGGTVPPTIIQMVGINSLVAQVSFADADTVATITHNMQITALGLSCLQPYLTYYAQLLATPASGTLAVLTFALTSSNVVTINKTANTGTGGTYVVRVLRG